LEPVMSLYVLDALLWIIGIRGHVSHYEAFRPGGNESSPGTGTLRRVLAGIVISVLALSLVLWTAVWLAIKLL
jgi:hypothetical protein